MQIDLRCILAALDDLSWLGRPLEAPLGHPAPRRIATDLELPILDGSGKGSVRKSALIDLGPAQRVDGSILVDIAWRPASFAPLFPVFAGHLQINADRLALDGRCAPASGKLGLLIDGALLHLVARRTAQAFLGRLAARCLAATGGRQLTDAAWNSRQAPIVRRGRAARQTKEGPDRRIDPGRWHPAHGRSATGSRSLGRA